VRGRRPRGVQECRTDASGVTVLVEAYQQAHRCGVPFRVVDASGTVLTVLQLVGLYSILKGLLIG
jgi:anti-anti-sigma regulatory factor